MRFKPPSSEETATRCISIETPASDAPRASGDMQMGVERSKVSEGTAQLN